MDCHVYEDVKSKFEIHHDNVIKFLETQLSTLYENRLLTYYQTFVLESISIGYANNTSKTYTKSIYPQPGIIGAIGLIPYILGTRNIAVIAPDDVYTRFLSMTFGIRDIVEESFVWRENIITDRQRLINESKS